MIIQQKTGNIKDAVTSSKIIEVVLLEWYETNKRILHKQTTSGRNITLKFLGESHRLTDGDILFEDDTTIIAVTIIPCESIVIRPKNKMEIAAICYEIGNKHLPVFFYNDELLIAFEMPLYNLLSIAGYNVLREERKLMNPLKTSVAVHPKLSDHLIITNKTT